VTPIGYLDFLQTFKILYDTLITNMQNLITRYENGLSKLKNTEKEVNIMQLKLEGMKPILENKN